MKIEQTCPACKATVSVGSICESCKSYVNSVSDYVPTPLEASEEFKIFKIVITNSMATTLLDPNSLSKLSEVFPKAQLLSEWRKAHPLAFARTRFNNGFLPAPAEGLRIQDGEFVVVLNENGMTVAGPRPVQNVLNTVSAYMKKLQACGLYSKELFASKFIQIVGTAKMPSGWAGLGRIDLSNAARYLEDASFNPVESMTLVYNMKAMDVQIWLEANGQIRFATNIEESNIARALRLLQQSLKETRDVSIETVRVQEDKDKPKFVFCVGCGAKLPVDATFCRGCGIEQPKL